MGLVERFSKLRSRWSRNFPPNLARLMLLGCAALWGGSYLLAKFAIVSFTILTSTLSLEITAFGTK